MAWGIEEKVMYRSSINAPQVDEAEGVQLQVTNVSFATPTTKIVRLALPSGGILPKFEPGAHIEVKVKLSTGEVAWNAYSLIGDSSDRTSFEIAIKRAEHGLGGSAYLHDVVHAGDKLELRGPYNGFFLNGAADSHLLIAGGVGITPIYAMSAHLSRLKVRHRLIYCVRSARDAPLLDRLANSSYVDIELHASRDEAKGHYDFALALGTPVAGQQIYACGPYPLVRKIIDIAERSGWDRQAVRCESFGGVQDVMHPKVIVNLARRKKTIVVEHPETILGALERNGIDPLYGCRRGECGICSVAVLDGKPSHRDFFLPEDERTLGKWFCPCVSWSESEEITLDL